MGKETAWSGAKNCAWVTTAVDTRNDEVLRVLTFFGQGGHQITILFIVITPKLCRAIDKVLGHLGGLIDHLDKPVEEVVAVLGARGGFGVILDAEGFFRFVFNAFICFVKQAYMSDLYIFT